MYGDCRLIPVKSWFNFVIYSNFYSTFQRQISLHNASNVESFLDVAYLTQIYTQYEIYCDKYLKSASNTLFRLILCIILSAHGVSWLCCVSLHRVFYLFIPRSCISIHLHAYTDMFILVFLLISIYVMNKYS